MCRVPRNWLPLARALLAANQPGQSRLISLPGTTRTMRLVSVRLPTGELEVLAASLLDEALCPALDFAGLSHLRWGVETFFGLLKRSPGGGALERRDPASRAPGPLCQRVLIQRGKRPRRARPGATARR